MRLAFSLLIVVILNSPVFAEERSFWLHASLGLLTQRNYFGSDFPATAMPTEQEVVSAARVLAAAGVNRLYLIYHREVPLEDAPTLFKMWRSAIDRGIELVPALVLRMYDLPGSPIFNRSELLSLTDFFQNEINAERIAVYEIAANRDLGEGLKVIGERYPNGLIRLGLQPEEKVEMPFVLGVADTWSAFCHGKRNERDWLQPGFGAESLGKWVRARNIKPPVPIVWNLISVAWDYAATERGGVSWLRRRRQKRSLAGGSQSDGGPVDSRDGFGRSVRRV